MPITKGFRQLVAEANDRVRTLTIAEAKQRRTEDGVVFVDLRDPRELEREGVMPGAFHATRGMLEFWVDPESPYYKPMFGEDHEFVLFCGGGWRSALAAATLMDMGMTNVAHMDGGFAAWKAEGGEVGVQPPRTPRSSS